VLGTSNNDSVDSSLTGDIIEWNTSDF